MLLLDVLNIDVKETNFTFKKLIKKVKSVDFNIQNGKNFSSLVNLNFDSKNVFKNYFKTKVCLNALNRGSKAFYQIADCDENFSTFLTQKQVCSEENLSNKFNYFLNQSSISINKTHNFCEKNLYKNCFENTQKNYKHINQFKKNIEEFKLNQLDNSITNCNNFLNQYKLNNGNYIKNALNHDKLNVLNLQSTKTTIRERIAHMCLNSYLADICFIVGEKKNQQKIFAHKFVLSISSTVFDKMFQYDFYNLPHQLIQEIELTDIEPKALIVLLTFLYKDEVLITAEIAIPTLYAAKKYAILALEHVCANFLKENLNIENAFMLLAQSRLFDQSNLTENCLEIIDRNTAEALKTDGFKEIDYDTLCIVLKRDALRINELSLFKAILSWSIEECKRNNIECNPKNQQKVLGQALHLIRYTEMTIIEFAENVAISNLLSDKELVNIFLHFTMSCPPPILFPIAQKRRFVGKQMVINRFQKIEASWGYSGTPDRIKFTVDVAIWVLGFGLYGSMHDLAKYNVIIEIINFENGQILSQCDTSFQTDGSTSIFPVMFKEPIEITPNFTYIASAKLSGVESYYGSKGLRKIVRQLSISKNSSVINTKNSVANNSITFQFSYAAGNNNGTSVDDGQIPQIIFSEKF